MVTANFEIGNKEFELRFIRESGYPPTNNERGSSLVEYDVTTYKDIKPIPLTSEILEKNGWRKTKIYYKLDLNNHQEVWAYENHDYTYDILVGFKKDDILSTIKEGLKYVSELQNILFGLDLNHGMEV